jgi:hypothetical protein
MRSVIDKTESRRIRTEIRDVLLQVWDPIGVRDEPNAQDEYDSYVPGIFELLTAGASDECLGKHLLRIVNEQMELPANGENMENTIAALRQIELLK